MKYIDLHVHSNASDGTYAPSQLVEYALQKKLSAFALTDHDTISGIESAIQSSKNTFVTVIPGVELSTTYHSKDVHILGLFIDYTSEWLINQLNELNNLRSKRNVLMCELLSKEGFDISISKLHEKFGDTVITRAHFARYLLDKGYTTSMKEAFDKYIDKGGPCYVPKVKCTPKQAIDIIKKAGGVPILAHPLLYHFSNEELEELIIFLKNNGLEGIEAIYSLNEGKDEENMLGLAKKYNLKITGGSDFHGSNKPDIDLGVGKGNLRIPFSLLEQFTLS
ncbi:PHP domain-containing protein [Candidatus Galacturonibacter soehngenii]|uniref:PHP domain-containing protein n=1 Tax=Candidatus Galacturonatibacter soehngenii TaxID=2307010 RepID=A0A7V7QMF7_9FIRM|nr:PHP domain-containing protein [Candidatus Galacturonibacter soehngenii]KAB1439861.1 PHP domain-containing protein [Candidatus Galacturonibacter soehngenii]MBA4685904.1 PHP domain-containing protein [Candidatus Galacturonibacter soehngenii]